jgi:hypothetical protein
MTMNKTLLGLCTLSLLTACSGPAIKDAVIIQQTALSQAQSSEQDPQQAIENSRNLQVNAQQEDLYFYSPSYMAQAEKEIALAEEALKQNKPASVTITHSLTAKALFERGLATKQTVTNQLAPSFDGITMLKQINSHVLVKDDFEDIEDDIKDLILLIEQGNINDAIKDQKDVLTDIAQLEKETLKVAYFTPAQSALDKAEDADAEEFATQTFEIAEEAVDKLERLIKSQYKKRDLITERSKATIRLAQHAENVAKAAKPLLKINAEQAEQHILHIESLLDRITKALNHDSINHMPLNNQSIALAQAVETLTKQVQNKQSNAKWDNEKQALKASIDDLKKQSKDDTIEVKPSTQTTPANIQSAIKTDTAETAKEKEKEKETNTAQKEMQTTEPQITTTEVETIEAPTSKLKAETIEPTTTEPVEETVTPSDNITNPQS